MRNTFIILLIISISFFACKKMIDPSLVQSNFPKEIASIFINKCATSGCHNDKSYQNAGGLNLTSYQKLFEGAVNGAVAVPYSASFSSMFQFVNTYDDLGLHITPSMPLNADALSREEVIAIKNWLDNGCPDIDGNIPFSSDADTRPKAYVTNQGCDVVSVIDAETQLVMRYVKVGKLENVIEIPHFIKLSDDKKYWYVCFTNGTYIQKFDAVSDKLLETIEIGNGLWNIIKLSHDGNTAFVSDLSSNGKIAEVNLQSKAVKTYTGGLFDFPHGIALTESSDTLYITAQYGNMIYRLIPKINKLDKISLQKGIAPVTTSGILDPHEILMDNDYKRYFVTCQNSNEVRVMQTGADTLLKTIAVGGFPLEMSISKKKNLLFVTCQEDFNPISLAKGSVFVIDLQTLQTIKIIKEKFYQPHGIVVDDERGYLYVFSRNANQGGPAPHHTSECGGRNGFYHVIDINSWQVIRSGFEISVDPYSSDFK